MVISFICEIPVILNVRRAISGVLCNNCLGKREKGGKFVWNSLDISAWDVSNNLLS